MNNVNTYEAQPSLDALAAAFLNDAARAMPQFETINPFHIAAWKGVYFGTDTTDDEGFFHDIIDYVEGNGLSTPTEGVAAILYSIDEVVNRGDILQTVGGSDPVRQAAHLTAFRNLRMNLKLFEDEAPLTSAAARKLFHTSLPNPDTALKLPQ